MRTGSTAVAIQILLLTVAGVPAVFAGTGLSDAAFERVPFDQWRSEGNQSLIPWSVEVVPPELSGHQRLLVGVNIQVDGRKTAKRHVKDQLLALVQFEDAEGTVWRTHGWLKREDAGDIGYTQSAFVLPGDYVVSVAVSDSAGLRHSFAEKKLHVPSPKIDPLPRLWDGLPRVEFFSRDADSPDAWFLPEIGSKLHMPVQTRRPVHIDVLLNTTPGDRGSGPVGELRRNMSVLIPELKVISQMDLSSGSMDVAFLDLTRRQEVGVLNWEDMQGFFARTNPGIVDVKALDGQWKMRSFFLERLTSRIEATREAERVMIVLSGPAFFEGQEPVAPIAIPQNPATRVFYIRSRAIPRSVLEPRPRPRQGARPPRPPQRNAFALPLDDLERPLDTPGSRLFDVVSPEQFRRVLAAVIGQISGM